MKIALRQKRYLASGATVTGAWPLQIRARTANGIMKIALPADADATTEIEVPEGTFLLNSAGANYFISSYDQQLLGILAANLKELSAPERLFLIYDAWSGPLAAALKLTEGFVDEDAPAVWTEIHKNMSDLRRLVDARGDEADTRAVNAWCRSIVANLAKRVPFDRVDGETVLTAELRGVTYGTLLAAKDEATIEMLKSKFPPSESVDPNVKSLIYTAAAQNPCNHPELRKLYDASAANPPERARILAACSVPPVTDLSDAAQATVDDILDWAIPAHGSKGPVKPQDAYSVIITAASYSRVAQVLVWRWLQKSWSRVTKMYGSGQFLIAAIVGRSFTRFASEDEAAEVERFFAEHGVESAKRSAAQAVEGIRSRASTWERYGADVSKYLREKFP